MITKIMKTFMQFIPILVLCLLGFAFPFFMLVQNQSPFNSFLRSFVKSLSMMIGEFDYGDIFDNASEENNKKTCVCGLEHTCEGMSDTEIRENCVQ